MADLGKLVSIALLKQLDLMASKLVLLLLSNAMSLDEESSPRMTTAIAVFCETACSHSCVMGSTVWTTAVIGF